MKKYDAEPDYENLTESQIEEYYRYFEVAKAVIISQGVGVIALHTEAKERMQKVFGADADAVMKHAIETAGFFTE